jgi:hypothetical protein
VAFANHQRDFGHTKYPTNYVSHARWIILWAQKAFHLEHSSLTTSILSCRPDLSVQEINKIARLSHQGLSRGHKVACSGTHRSVQHLCHMLPGKAAMCSPSILNLLQIKTIHLVNRIPLGACKETKSRVHAHTRSTYFVVAVNKGQVTRLRGALLVACKKIRSQIYLFTC